MIRRIDSANLLRSAIDRFHKDDSIFYGYFQGLVITTSLKYFTSDRLGPRKLRSLAGLDSIIAHLIYLRYHDESIFK